MDDAGIERLFEDHFDAIYGYLARRVGPDLARDLAAETFTQAYRGRRRYDAGRGSALAWLYGIAHNLLRRHYRDEERALAALAPLDARPAREDAEPWLAAALGDLGRDERDVLLLYAWAGLSYDEIALAVGVPIGTVRSRLHRARRRLRDAMTREEAAGG